MLGHRGCRLAVTYPEICRMQARAIFEAASNVAKSDGSAPVPEVMIPLAATAKEVELCKAVIDAEAAAVAVETGITITYLVGTMVELPRAAICADDLARQAEFFSFGTNDLTQTALGISRDDLGASSMPIQMRKSIRLTRLFRLMSRCRGAGAHGGERGRETRSDIAWHLRRAWR